MEKKTLVTQSWVLSDAWCRDLKIKYRGLEIKLVENYFILENYVTSEGAVSNIVLYYQPLPITHFQVRFLCYSNYQEC